MNEALVVTAPTTEPRMDQSDSARNGEAVSRSSASKQSLRGLDWLNFFLADVQSGVGPFLAIYLAGSGWNEQTIGIACARSAHSSLAALLLWRLAHC